MAKDTDAEDPSEVIGVAMWMPPSPPGHQQTWTELYDSWVMWLKSGLINLRYRGRGGLIANRYYLWKKRQAETQAEVLTDPNGYYFCNIVVVSRN